MIEIKYSCFTCGIVQRAISVRERGSAEDVRDWVDAARLAVTIDHRSMSPLCKADKLDELHLPITPGTYTVGHPVKH